MMMIAITQAKIGRSMKTRDMGLATRVAGQCPPAPGGGALRICGVLAGTGLIVGAVAQVGSALGDDFSPAASPWVTTQWRRRCGR